MSTFANPHAIKLINENFIAVAADDWYQRRRTDAVGKFFREVAEQGPRAGDDGSTKQGIYCLTASGKLLSYGNSRNVQHMYGEFKKSLAKFQQLPTEEREPGAVKVPPLDEKGLDRHFTRKLPEGAIAVRVFARVLERDANGKCKTCSATAGQTRQGLLSSLDHLWITAEEWRKLIPRTAKAGDEFSMPKAVAMRIARFHLIDNTRGEPDMWKQEEVRKNDVKLTVVEATPDVLKLRIDGEVLLSTTSDVPAESSNVAKGQRGYDVRILGGIQIDRQKNVIAEFNAVALGDHWGESRYTPGARPGKTPLGIVFELADGKQAADSVPPQASRDIDGYLRP